MDAAPFSQQPAGYSFTPEKHTSIVEYRGNSLEFDRPKKPAYYIEKDPVTGEEHTKGETWANEPKKLNGQKIYCSTFDKEVSKPKINAKDKSLADYILRNTRAEFEKLGDGEYNMIIPNVVINREGKVVYYEN